MKSSGNNFRQFMFDQIKEMKEHIKGNKDFKKTAIEWIQFNSESFRKKWCRDHSCGYKDLK